MKSHKTRLTLLIVAAMIIAMLTGITVASAADDTTYLAFSSDVHYNTSNETNNLEDWMDAIKKLYPKFDSMSFCGDLGSAYCSTAAQYWKFSQAVMDTAESYVGTQIVRDPVYTFGNHEWYPSAGGDYANNKDNATAKKYLNRTEAISTDKYRVYAYGAEGSDQEYTDEGIAELDAYLASCPTDIPIFVLVHFPLHYFSSRVCANAESMVEMLNSYPNVFLIWGHNHNVSDTNYDHFQKAGDLIELLPGIFTEINFTYCSAGCMSDAEYATGSAFVKGKGLVVQIDGLNVTMNYYDLKGKQVGETFKTKIDPKGGNKEGPFTVRFRDGLGMIVSEQTVKKGEAATAPEIEAPLGYQITGWNKDFSSVTRDMTVSPVMELLDMNPQITALADVLDPNYVYVTIQVDQAAAVGKSGAPIILYPVPYKDGMTVGDAFIKVHELEYESGTSGASTYDTTYGFWSFEKIWGHTPQNGSLCFDPTEPKCWIDSNAAAVPGACYYSLAYDSNWVSTSAMYPAETTTVTGKNITLCAMTFAMDASYNYAPEPFQGDVYCGTSYDSLTDTGVDSNVMGYFNLSFDKAGDYYILVKPHEEGRCNAALGKVHVDEGSGKTVYFNISIDDYVCTDKEGNYIAHYPVVLDEFDNIGDAILQLHAKALNNNGKWTAVYSETEKCFINTQVMGVMNISSVCGMGATYVNDENAPVTDLTRIPDDGDVITLHGFTNSSYTAWRAGMFDIKYAEIGVGEEIKLTAGRIGANSPSGSTGYGPIKPTSGKIFIDFEDSGKSTDADGAVTLSFDKEGTYIVTMESGNSWSCAISVIKVGKGGSMLDKEALEEKNTVVMRSNQKITVDGEEVAFDVYNINGNNYFKLRDIAMKLDGTDSTFAVGYDSATRTITCTTGKAYEANGSELVIGDDLSATAVKSNQPLYVNGALSTIKAYNLGGNNFFQLRELGQALDFVVDYDSATRTVIINTDKPEALSYKMTVVAASSMGEYEVPDDGDFKAYATSSDTGFESKSLGFNNNNGFYYYFTTSAFPSSYNSSDWSTISMSSGTKDNNCLTIRLELDEGSSENKHAVVGLSENYAEQEEQTVYLILRAKSGNPYYLYKITITPAAE